MFLLYDTESKGYCAKAYGKIAAHPAAMNTYKRFAPAMQRASLHNVSRNVPRGMTANHKFSNRPQVEIHEIDDLGEVIAIHQAPPVYLSIDTATQTISEHI